MTSARGPPRPGATATAQDDPTSVGAALHAALWAMRTHNAKALVESGVTGPQSGVLWFLHEYKALSLTRLAEMQGNTPANMTGLVGRLERDGLVVRKRHPDDRRVVMVELTAEGATRTKKARRAVEKAMGQLFAGIAPADLQATLRVLEQVRQRADAGNPPT
jgi:MarR family transcriptional regulator for hemolysin